MARKRGVFQDPAAFTAQREAALEELDKRHAVNVDEDDKDESLEKKLENLLQDAFEAEQVLYLKYYSSYAIHQLDGTVTWKPECATKYALPLEPSRRYLATSRHSTPCLSTLSRESQGTPSGLRRLRCSPCMPSSPKWCWVAARRPSTTSACILLLGTLGAASVQDSARTCTRS